MKKTLRTMLVLCTLLIGLTACETEEQTDARYFLSEYAWESDMRDGSIYYFEKNFTVECNYLDSYNHEHILSGTWDWRVDEKNLVITWYREDGIALPSTQKEYWDDIRYTGNVISCYVNNSSKYTTFRGR